MERQLRLVLNNLGRAHSTRAPNCLAKPALTPFFTNHVVVLRPRGLILRRWLADHQCRLGRRGNSCGDEDTGYLDACETVDLLSQISR